MSGQSRGLKLTSAIREIPYSELKLNETPLGSGKFGTVYRAEWLPQKMIVAVKRVLVLEKEADILCGLRHKNIVEFYGAVMGPHDFCIVTEFAQNGSLYQYLSNSANPDLDFTLMVTWARDIASGINYLHADAPVTVIHRDLKSSNVVITAENVCKLCDFGTSKSVQQSTHRSLAGTFAWMSPEMLRSDVVTTASDIYSFGVVLWELVTRQIPFKGLEDFTIMYQVAQNHARLPIPERCPFKDLINSCWQEIAADRPKSAGLLSALDTLLRSSSASRETASFLERRSEWTGEIEAIFDELKRKDTNLSTRESQLQEKEQQLMKREQSLNNFRRLQRQASYDINLWTVQEVVDWIRNQSTATTVDPKELDEVIAALEEHQINGQRLLLLTQRDLDHMGIQAVGYRREIIDTILHLRRENERLINFPPLDHAKRKESFGSGTGGVGSKSTLNVQLNFGVGFYGHQEPPDAAAAQFRWKLFLDIVGWEVNNGDIGGDFDPWNWVSDVMFMLQAPPYATYKVRPSNNCGALVIPDWIIGYQPGLLVNCVVNYVDSIRQPRNTKLALEIRWSQRGELVIKCVPLTIVATVPEKQPFSAAMKTTHSSPQLQGAWSEKVFHDRVPSYPPMQTPKKNPTWADIAAVIDPGRKNSLSTPSPQPTSAAFQPRYETPQRAISDQTTKSGSNFLKDLTDGTPLVKPRANSATLPRSELSPSPLATRVSFSVEENGLEPAPPSSYFNVPEIRLETPSAAKCAGRRGRGGKLSYQRSRSDGVPYAGGKRNGEQNHLETLPEEVRPTSKQQQYSQKLHCPTGSTRSATIHGGRDKWMWKKDKD